MIGREASACVDYCHYAVMWRKYLTVNANKRDFQSETRLRLTNAAAQTAPRAG